jgi:murein DD-endopeptidase MepM/ murein hydrolase activator NlpD
MRERVRPVRVTWGGLASDSEVNPPRIDLGRLEGCIAHLSRPASCADALPRKRAPVRAPSQCPLYTDARTRSRQRACRRFSGADAPGRHDGAASQRLRTNSVPIRAHPGQPGRPPRSVVRVRATSTPTVLAVAALAAAILVPLGLPGSASAARWVRPVPGEVARSFSYTRATPFERGAHRGVDLAAAPGTAVRAACAGTVVHAGPVARMGRVVSVRCGARRVSYLPLASVDVRAGARIAAGTPLGTVAAGHGGLHFGVRAEADRFGYEDPLALLASPRTSPRAPLVPAPRPSRRAPRPIAAPRTPAVRPPARTPRPSRRAPRPVAAPRTPAVRPPARTPRPVVAPRVPFLRPSRRAPRPVPAPRAPAARRGDAPRVVLAGRLPRSAAPPAARPTSSPGQGVAPPIVWAGLGLLLAGAAGSGTLAVRRRRAARRAPAATPPVRQAA